MELTHCADPACDAPASIAHEVGLEGVDYDGQARLFLLARVVCARGHQYDRIDDDPVEDLT